jgi:hypothetical protein
MMSRSIEPNEKSQPAAEEQSVSDKNQKQSDPQLTELKGFVDPKEKLEPEGTDNDTSLT